MKARAHIFVKGSVQGVFFRANTREKAKTLGFKWEEYIGEFKDFEIRYY